MPLRAACHRVISPAEEMLSPRFDARPPLIETLEPADQREIFDAAAISRVMSRLFSPVIMRWRAARARFRCLMPRERARACSAFCVYAARRALESPCRLPAAAPLLIERLPRHDAPRLRDALSDAAAAYSRH